MHALRDGIVLARVRLARVRRVCAAYAGTNVCLGEGTRAGTSARVRPPCAHRAGILLYGRCCKKKIPWYHLGITSA